MKKAILNVVDDNSPDDIHSLLETQEEILQELKKENYRLFNMDIERTFLRERNTRLKKKLSELINIVKKLTPSGSQV